MLKVWYAIIQLKNGNISKHKFAASERVTDELTALIRTGWRDNKDGYAMFAGVNYRISEIAVFEFKRSFMWNLF